MYIFLRRLLNLSRRSSYWIKNNKLFNSVNNARMRENITSRRWIPQPNIRQLPRRHYSGEIIQKKLVPLPKGSGFIFILLGFFLVNRGNAWSEKGEHDNAIKDYDKAIELNPNFEVAYCNRGNAWDKKGEHDKAIKDYDKAIELNPDFEVAYYNRGIAWYKKGEHDKAIKDCDKAIELNPHNATAYCNRGNAWSEKGEHDKAIKDHDKAIELNPHNATAYSNRGVAWSRKGEHDKAIKDYDRAIELNPHYEAAYSNRGNAWSEKGEHDKAIKDCDKAIELNPHYETAYSNRANAWYKKGEHDNAIKDYDKAIELNPHDEIAYYNRGNAWSEKGEYDNAIKDYDKAIELNPHDETAYSNRGAAWSEKGEHDNAIKDCDKAIELNPHYETAYSNRGAAWYKKGKHEQAIKDYDKAITLNPDDEKAYFNQSLVYIEKNKFEQSLPNLNKLIEISKNNKYLFKLIDYCKHLEKYQFANDICALMLKKNPHDKQVYFLQGEILLHLNEPVKAVSSFRKAREIDPNFIEAQHALDIAKKRTGLLPSALEREEKKILLKSLSIEDYPTHYIYAHLCGETYKENPKAPDGWDILCTSKSPEYKQSYDKEDYFGIAFRHQATKQIVIAHKGTKLKSWGDIVADARLFVQRIPKQYDIAKGFVSQVEKEYLPNAAIKHSSAVLHTGHSLGAGIAQLLASLSNQSAVTFDSPGIKEILEIQYAGQPYSANNIIGYLTRPNLVNTCNHHIGYRLKLNLLGLEDQPSIITDSIGVGAFIAGYFGLKKERQYFYDLRNITDIVLRQCQSHRIENIIQAFNSISGECQGALSKVIEWPHGTQNCIMLEDTALELKEKTSSIYPNSIPDKYIRHKIKNIIGYQFTQWDMKSLPLTIFDNRTMNLLKAHAENSLNDTQKKILKDFDAKILQMFHVKKDASNEYQLIVSDKSNLSIWEIKGYIEYHVDNTCRRENITFYSPLEPTTPFHPFLSHKLSFAGLFCQKKNEDNLTSFGKKVSVIENILSNPDQSNFPPTPF